MRKQALVVFGILAFAVYVGSAAAHSTGFPSKGKVVPGKTIGGVGLTDTTLTVVHKWGRNYKVCTYCKKQTWFYEYPTGEPLGAAVKFEKGKVVSVFTLGSPAGWGVKGVMMGDPVSNVYNLFGNTGSVSCIGYDALTIKIGASTMSFYTTGGTIYGFALTGPTEPVCQ
jgi:hypothetical protein